MQLQPFRFETSEHLLNRPNFLPAQDPTNCSFADKPTNPQALTAKPFLLVQRRPSRSLSCKPQAVHLCSRKVRSPDHRAKLALNTWNPSAQALNLGPKPWSVESKPAMRVAKKGTTKTRNPSLCSGPACNPKLLKNPKLFPASSNPVDL